MKYLGLHLDSHWRFNAHLDRLFSRLREEIANFGRLLLNLGGPSDRCRRLYLAVVRSIALYGASVWSAALTNSRRNIELLQSAQRLLSVRAIRGYRTITFEAACELAASPPWKLVARSHASVYLWRTGIRAGGGEPSLRAVEVRRRQSRQLLMQEWEERLVHARAGLRAVGAIHPVLEHWVDRRHGELTFRLVQVISGHGCFGDYLHHRANREPMTRCHHCSEEVDTAQHTLEECPA